MILFGVYWSTLETCNQDARHTDIDQDSTQDTDIFNQSINPISSSKGHQDREQWEGNILTCDMLTTIKINV